MSREDDLELLRGILAPANDAERTTGETNAFGDMLVALESGLRTVLSERQRAWAEQVAGRFAPIKAAEVPRGREVATPPVLQNLPKKPPPLPKPDGRAGSRKRIEHCGAVETGCFAFVNGQCTCDCCRG